MERKQYNAEIYDEPNGWQSLVLMMFVAFLSIVVVDAFFG